jgi:hypothetical protein
MFSLKTTLKGLAAASLMASSVAFAGPFILAGTDADDHGSVSGGVNQDGWFFMQRALENLGAGVTNGNTTVAFLGSTSSALTAATSAFNLSSLAGTGGWTSAAISTGSFADFFSGVGTVNIGNVGILMMDSDGNVGGGVNGSAFVPYASIINNFVGAGGGLFSQANGYAWLTALLPAVTVTNSQATGLTLTAAGNSIFPGLTNADLSAGPHHNYFNNFSPIPVLANRTNTNLAVIIGGTGGSITNPGGPSVPVPGSVALLGAGLVLLGALRRQAPQA